MSFAPLFPILVNGLEHHLSGLAQPAMGPFFEVGQNDASLLGAEVDVGSFESHGVEQGLFGALLGQFGQLDAGASSTLGTAIGLPMLTFFMLHLGWRRMFAVMGLFGLAVALVIHWLYRDPGQTSSLTPAERQYLADDHPERPRVSWRAWKSLFRFRTVWGMIGGFCGANYCIWIYTAWLPQYLEIQFHVTVANSGWIGSIPFLCGAAGSIITGRPATGSFGAVSRPSPAARFR